MVLTHVDLPEDGAGVVAHAIRATELANALRRAGHDVAIAKAPETIASSADATFFRNVANYEVVIVSGALSRTVKSLKDFSPGCAVAIDLFDAPLVGEIPDLEPGIAGEIALEFRRLALQEASAYADLFLCATNEQRLWLLGLLSAWGRLNPQTYHRELVIVIPTGTPRERPLEHRERLFRGRIVPKDATILLWPGGIFNHYRPMPLLLALPSILDLCPSAHIVFVGASNAAFSPDNPILAEVHRTVERMNATEKRIHFEPPLPYFERGRMYVEADIAVCLFEESLETELSFRTRLVDILWGGIPMVMSRGNSLSDLIEESGAGVGVSDLTADAVLAAVTPLLLDPAKRLYMGARARECAESRLGWDAVVMPLSAFCDQPRTSVDAGSVSVQMSKSLLAGFERRLRLLMLRLRRKANSRHSS